jgi:LmbE family N-acetylglucosaminyl deacetylase
MRGLSLAADHQLRRILAIGCHPDDIEIGAGGTILSLLGADAAPEVTWVVLSAHGERAQEARSSADAFLDGAASSDVRVHGFRDGFLSHEGAQVKETFESLKETCPDLILTHCRHDLHQDHRLASDLTWQTFRNHLILEYEIPKYDGDLGSRNVFVPLTEAVLERKLRLLDEHHATQSGKHWFDADLFRGLARLRGMESATRYAEAFTCRKLVLRPPSASP